MVTKHVFAAFAFSWLGSAMPARSASSAEPGTTIVTATSSINVAAFTPPPVGHLNQQIIEEASGNVPNTSTPLKLTAEAVTSFQLLLFLEELEVYLYYEGLKNLTNGQWNLTGLPVDTVDVIAKTAAQEDIHVATLATVLEGNNASTIQPCKYSFPASSPTDFFAIANLITPTNFGSIIGVQNQLAPSDPSIILSSSSILATEVRHEVFLRSTAGEIPNPAPFDTGLPPSWAYNIGLSYTIPGTCPTEIALPEYPSLFFEGRPKPAFAPTTPPTSINLEWDSSQQWVSREKGKQLYVAWLNLANQPQYTELKVSSAGKGSTAVPSGLADMAFIAITSLKPDNIIDLAGATLCGPLGVPIS